MFVIHCARGGGRAIPRSGDTTAWHGAVPAAGQAKRKGLDFAAIAQIHAEIMAVRNRGAAVLW